MAALPGALIVVHRCHPPGLLFGVPPYLGMSVFGWVPFMVGFEGKSKQTTILPPPPKKKRERERERSPFSIN